MMVIEIMAKIFESWISCFIVVIGLVALGALFGYDLAQFQGVSNIITAIGTLMLGFAAFLAFPIWTQQQRSRFQASISAECYAKLSLITYKLNTDIPNFRAAQFISDNSHSTNIPSEKALAKQEIIKDIEELLMVLKDFIVPRSTILGSDFYDKVEAFTFELDRLTSGTQLQKITSQNLEDVIQQLDSLLCFLRRKSMFEI
ncbi:hypothetical protein LG272_10515 [Pseudidiomarina marina]|uniref:hypothetical protein n=1 Tax=Pseudidiomarina marina TaxID=502366 RepID=UPI00384DBD64